MRNPWLAALACGALAHRRRRLWRRRRHSSERGGGGDLSGAVTIDGSSTVFPFAQAAAEGFQGENRGVKVTVGESGTGGGFEKFCAGETDISDASRPIDDEEEVPICKKNGIDVLGDPGRQRRHRRRHEPGAEDRVPHHRPAEGAVEEGLEHHELRRSSASGIPSSKVSPLRPRHRLRHVRLLHRGDQRREGRHAHRLPALRGRQRARPGRLRRQTGDSATSASRTTRTTRTS